MSSREKSENMKCTPLIKRRKIKQFSTNWTTNTWLHIHPLPNGRFAIMHELQCDTMPFLFPHAILSLFFYLFTILYDFVSILIVTLWKWEMGAKWQKKSIVLTNHLVNMHTKLQFNTQQTAGAPSMTPITIKLSIFTFSFLFSIRFFFSLIIFCLYPE